MMDVARARMLVDRLRSADHGLDYFAASSHRWVFEPTLAIDELTAWERTRQATLPDDYVAFLTQLGNGGAGPFYGIFPFGTYDGGELDVDGIACPFRFREAWNLPADRFEAPDDFDSDDDESAWHDALRAEYRDPALLDGAMWICDHGCALRTLLVVTGPARGTVWFDGRADNLGIKPHMDESGRHLSFGDWYSDWLERALVEVTG